MRVGAGWGGQKANGTFRAQKSPLLSAHHAIGGHDEIEKELSEKTHRE